MAGAVKVGLWGGNGGSPKDVGSASGIKIIQIRAGSVVDRIRIFYTDGPQIRDFTIGGNGGSDQPEINLEDGEYLTSVSGYVNVFSGITCVAQLSFATNRGNKHGPYGDGGGTPFSLPIADGQVLNFFGRGGSYVDAIGAYLGPN